MFVFLATNVKSSEKRAKRILTIAPLNLTPADFEGIEKLL